MCNEERRDTCFFYKKATKPNLTHIYLSYLNIT